MLLLFFFPFYPPPSCIPLDHFFRSGALFCVAAINGRTAFLFLPLFGRQGGALRRMPHTFLSLHLRQRCLPTYSPITPQSTRSLPIGEPASITIMALSLHPSFFPLCRSDSTIPAPSQPMLLSLCSDEGKKAKGEASFFSFSPSFFPPEQCSSLHLCLGLRYIAMRFFSSLRASN